MTSVFERQRGMPPKGVTYQPKGSMCMACVHRAEDCSHLPFASMKLIERVQPNTWVVLCDNYIKEN